MRTIFVEHKFTASHAVPRDALFSDDHLHDWTLVAHVTGVITGTGWIMPFSAIQEILAGVVPFSGDLNELAPNATVEALADVFWGLVSMGLPDRVALVKLELHEAPGCGVVLTEPHQISPGSQ